MSVTALQAAKRACAASDWRLSDLQLQKILYIAHMLYAGTMKGDRLISDEFEAWRYGPVLPSLYRWTKLFGADPIQSSLFRNITDIDASQPEAQIIDDAVRAFASDAPWKLVQVVHDKDSAWSRLYDPEKRHIKITQADIVNEHARRFPQGAESPA